MSVLGFFGHDTRHDFGPAIPLIKCCQCEKMIWNRGCRNCSRRFCVDCYAGHDGCTPDVCEPRYDFGPALPPVRCSTCQAMIWNRGCRTCGRRFCEDCYAEHGYAEHGCVTPGTLGIMPSASNVGSAVEYGSDSPASSALRVRASSTDPPSSGSPASRAPRVRASSSDPPASDSPASFVPKSHASKRKDFGPRLELTRCSRCGAMAWNRGCGNCLRRFCKDCYAEHGNCGTPVVYAQRHDFGPALPPVRCSSCRATIWNQGCRKCSKRFCQECYEDHCCRPPRHDFGAALPPIFCSTCGAMIWNRGCESCRQRFCTDCYAMHLSNHHCGGPRGGAIIGKPCEPQACLHSAPVQGLDLPCAPDPMMEAQHDSNSASLKHYRHEDSLPDIFCT